jgi:hypothetical protein
VASAVDLHPHRPLPFLSLASTLHTITQGGLGWPPLNDIIREKRMFSHIMIGTNDLQKAKTLYDAVLGTLGVPPVAVDGHRIFYMTPGGVFCVSQPIERIGHSSGIRNVREQSLCQIAKPHVRA